jgi:hypothetical protein
VQAGRFLAEHPELAGELEGRLRIHLGLAVPEAASA